MNRRWLGSLLGSMFLVTACGDDGGEGTGTDDGTGTGTTMMTTTNPTTTSPTASSSATGTSTGMNTESADTGSSSGEPTTDTDTSGSGSTGSTGDTEGSSSSGNVTPGDDYPPCEADEDCSDPYTTCWPPGFMSNFCTLECQDAETDCPVPTSGTAVPVCEGPPGTDICTLDCSEGECPDGMDCIEVFNLMRCSYPAP